VALTDMPMQVETISADQDIVLERDRPSRCTLLLEGFAATYKMTPRGQRQIVGLHIPGDTPDLQSTVLEVMDMSLCTLTKAKVAFIRHDVIDGLCKKHHKIARALWRETLVDAASFREWVVNVGRRDAASGLAHLLCEFVTRMRVVGLAEEDECQFPLTQAELGDVLGISTVHVNRVLMVLRGAGLISLQGARLTIFDWVKLKKAGEFDPTYLHLPEQVAA